MNARGQKGQYAEHKIILGIERLLMFKDPDFRILILKSEQNHLFENHFIIFFTCKVFDIDLIVLVSMYY